MPFAGRRMVTLEQVYMPITMREIVSNLSIGVSLSWSSHIKDPDQERLSWWKRTPLSIPAV